MNDAFLAERYQLAPRSLTLYKMAAKDYLRRKKRKDEQESLKIKALEVCADIQEGVDDSTLMLKYQLTPRQLQRLYRKIIAAGYFTPMDLAKRLSVTKSQILEAFVEAGIILAPQPMGGSNTEAGEQSESEP